MNKGTLYYEETTTYRRKDGTAGKKGRWVGEILVDGRRVRMRSTNYRNVLLFLDGKRKVARRKNAAKDADLRVIKGFPGYWLDADTGDIYNSKNVRLKYRKSEHGCEYATLRIEGHPHKVFKYRVWYAAINRLRYDAIPEDICITRGADGMPHPISKEEHAASSTQKANENRRKSIDKMLERTIYEADMLKTFYQTNDIGPVLLYIMEHRSELISNVRRSKRMKQQQAEDLFDKMTDRLVDRMMRGTSYVTSILHTLRLMMVHDRNRECSYDMLRQFH